MTMGSSKQLSVRLAASLFLALALSVGGCATPVDLTGPTPEALSDEKVAVGMSMSQVIERLGEPTWRYRKDEADLLLYDRIGDSYGMLIVWTPWPVPVPIPASFEGGARWCLLLEFDTLDVVTRRKVESQAPRNSACILITKGVLVFS